MWVQRPEGEGQWPRRKDPTTVRLRRLLRKWQRLTLTTVATIWSILRTHFRRSLVWWSGFVLIALGIGALIGSRLLVSGSQAPVTVWWQGTLQALGVGLIVGGLVDVLAITGLNRVIGQRQRINDSWRTVLDSEGQYPDRAAYEKAVDTFVLENWRQEEHLDPDVYGALIASGALSRLWKTTFNRWSTGRSVIQIHAGPRPGEGAALKDDLRRRTIRFFD